MAAAPRPLAILPEHRNRMERLRDRLGDLAGKRVVEPGCGAGVLTARLAEWVGPAGKIVAFDPADGMLRHCRRAIAKYPHIALLQASAETVELPTAAWDLVLCYRAYPHWKTRRCFSALLELAGAGVNGGGQSGGQSRAERHACRTARRASRPCRRRGNCGHNALPPGGWSAPRLMSRMSIFSAHSAPDGRRRP